MKRRNPFRGSDYRVRLLGSFSKPPCGLRKLASRMPNVSYGLIDHLDTSGTNLVISSASRAFSSFGIASITHFSSARFSSFLQPLMVIPFHFPCPPAIDLSRGMFLVSLNPGAMPARSHEAISEPDRAVKLAGLCSGEFPMGADSVQTGSTSNEVSPTCAANRGSARMLPRRCTCVHHPGRCNAPSGS